MTAAGLRVSCLVLATLAAARGAATRRRRGAVHARLSGGGTRGAAAEVLGGPGPRWPPVLAPPPWLGSRLQQCGCDLPPLTVWRGWLATGAGLVAVASWRGGPAAGLVAGAAVVAGPAVAWRLGRHHGQDLLEAALPAAVDEVARSLRSGASLRQAVAEAGRATPGPLGADLARVAAAAEQGASLIVALEWWGERRPLDTVRLVVAALCLGAETGGAQARAIDGVAATLRQRLAARAEARALATQARVSAVVIALAPLGFCLLASASDPRTSRFLLGEPIGLACLAGGLALDAAGALWMGRLTRIDP